jgi:hypothetical protein
LGDTAQEAKSLVESMTDANRRSAIPESRLKMTHFKLFSALSYSSFSSLLVSKRIKIANLARQRHPHFS